MEQSTFFEKRTLRSKVKADIVSKYFGIWARIISSYQENEGFERKLAYVDLFCGPGKYKDGQFSTPLLITQSVVASESLSRCVTLIFNDKIKEYVGQLDRNLIELNTENSILNEPVLLNEDVGDRIRDYLRATRDRPTLTFIDPFGYKGLSSDLIGWLISPWGSECVVFFNYRQFNRDITNPLTSEWIEDLLKKGRADILRSTVVGLTPREREKAIIDAVKEALIEVGAKYVFPFVFKDVHGSRSSQYLLHVCKHRYGLEKMKETMSKEGSMIDLMMGQIGLNPADHGQESLLEEFYPKHEELGTQLLRDFAGRRLLFKEVYEAHSVNSPYVRKDYRSALLWLEDQGLIECDPGKEARRANSLVETVCIEFVQ